MGEWKIWDAVRNLLVWGKTAKQRALRAAAGSVIEPQLHRPHKVLDRVPIVANIHELLSRAYTHREGSYIPQKKPPIAPPRPNASSIVVIQICSLNTVYNTITE